MDTTTGRKLRRAAPGSNALFAGALDSAQPLFVTCRAIPHTPTCMRREILRLPPKRFKKLVELVEMSENHADRLKEALRVQRGAAGIPDPQGLSASGDEECVIL
jgi:hypothetical protein